MSPNNRPEANAQKYVSSPKVQSPPQSPLTGNNHHLSTSLSHHSTINGFQAHSYCKLGAHSSNSTFNIKNPIHFNKRSHNTIDDLQEEVNDGGTENPSHGFDISRMQSSSRSHNNTRNNMLPGPVENPSHGFDISRMQSSSRSRNNTRNNMLPGPVEANATPKSIVSHQVVNGTQLHSYDLMGVHCQNNTFNIENPIYGLNFEGMHPSSGSGSVRNKNKDLVHRQDHPSQFPRANATATLTRPQYPPMQIQENDHHSAENYSYAQTCRPFRHPSSQLSDAIEHETMVEKHMFWRRFDGRRLDSYQANENYVTASSAKRYRNDDLDHSMARKEYAKKQKFL